MTYWYIVNLQPMCPICKKILIEHSEFEDKICKMITIKEFSNNSPGFDIQLDLSFMEVNSNDICLT